MTDGILQTLVEEDFGYKSEGGNWGRSEKHSSLVVNEDAQKWYWNSEDMGGDVMAYLLKVRKLNKKQAQEIIDVNNKIVLGNWKEKVEYTYTAPYNKLVDTFWTLGKENRDYWYARKLKDSTIDRYRLGFYNGWNTIPLYFNGELINFQIRRDIPEKKIGMWYKEKKWRPVLMNLELLNLVDTIYIVEGFVDAILLTQEGIPAVAQTGGGVYWSADWYPAFCRIKKVYYIADNDKVGIKAANRVARALGQDKVYVYRFEDSKRKYDSGDFFKDGGTGKEFKEIVESNAKNIFEIGELNESRNRH